MRLLSFSPKQCVEGLTDAWDAQPWASYGAKRWAELTALPQRNKPESFSPLHPLWFFTLFIKTTLCPALCWCISQISDPPAAHELQSSPGLLGTTCPQHSPSDNIFSSWPFPGSHITLFLSLLLQIFTARRWIVSIANAQTWRFSYSTGMPPDVPTFSPTPACKPLSPPKKNKHWMTVNWK